MADSMMVKRCAPEHVFLAYRKIGQGHVITANGWPGLYIGSSTLGRAVDLIADALSEHISNIIGAPVRYAFPNARRTFPLRLQRAALALNPPGDETGENNGERT